MIAGQTLRVLGLFCSHFQTDCSLPPPMAAFEESPILLWDGNIILTKSMRVLVVFLLMTLYSFIRLIHFYYICLSANFKEVL